MIQLFVLNLEGISKHHHKKKMYQFFLYKKMSGVITGFQKEDF